MLYFIGRTLRDRDPPPCQIGPKDKREGDVEKGDVRRRGEEMQENARRSTDSGKQCALTDKRKGRRRDKKKKLQKREVH
jgi:hypothetical protein